MCFSLVFLCCLSHFYSIRQITIKIVKRLVNFTLQQLDIGLRTFVHFVHFFVHFVHLKVLYVKNVKREFTSLVLHYRVGLARYTSGRCKSIIDIGSQAVDFKTMWYLSIHKKTQKNGLPASNNRNPQKRCSKMFSGFSDFSLEAMRQEYIFLVHFKTF